MTHALTIRPDGELRDRLDAHLAARRAGWPGGPTDEEVLRELLRRGLDAMETSAATDGRASAPDEGSAGESGRAAEPAGTDAIASRVDDVVDQLYAGRADG